MKTVMKRLVWLFSILIFHFRNVYSTPKSGPYDMIVNRIEHCDDQGTDEIHFGTKMSSKGNKLKTYTDDVVFAIPLDEHIKFEMEGQYLRNGAYVPKFLHQSFKGCEKFWKIIKGVTQDFFSAAGHNFTNCPLPAGTYSVKDWVVDLKINNVPSLTYGSYKWIISFLKKGKRVGCFSIYIDIVPKEV